MISSSPDLHWNHCDLPEASQASFTRIRILSAKLLFFGILSAKQMTESWKQAFTVLLPQE